MALFRTTDQRANQLEELDEIGFKNEREMQKTTENNLQDILGLDFVCREFSVKDRRIDTLAFDKEAKSFIIIEYKIGKNSSVVDQGMTYLSLMLENRAEFVLEYNRIKGAKMDKRSVDWSQSKVIFISHTFTRQQKGATNFMDFPVDMWEVKKYKNNLVDYKQVEKSATQASIKELLGKDKKMATKEKSSEKITNEIHEKTVGEVISEIKVYTEEDHLAKASKETKDSFNRFKDNILTLGDIRIVPKVKTVNFVANSRFVVTVIQKDQFKMWIRMPKGELDDPRKIMRDTSNIHNEAQAAYEKIITSDMSDADLKYILGLVEQSLEYDRKR